MARYTLTCLVLLPVSICVPIWPAVITVGFGTGITAVVHSRGRSGQGWIGVVCHGVLVGLALWAALRYLHIRW